MDVDTDAPQGIALEVGGHAVHGSAMDATMEDESEEEEIEAVDTVSRDAAGEGRGVFADEAENAIISDRRLRHGTRGLPAMPPFEPLDVPHHDREFVIPELPPCTHIEEAPDGCLENHTEFEEGCRDCRECVQAYGRQWNMPLSLFKLFMTQLVLAAVVVNTNLYADIQNNQRLFRLRLGWNLVMEGGQEMYGQDNETFAAIKAKVLKLRTVHPRLARGVYIKRGTPLPESQLFPGDHTIVHINPERKRRACQYCTWLRLNEGADL